MFDYIQSCQNPQDISYEGYLKNGVVSGWNGCTLENAKALAGTTKDGIVTGTQSVVSGLGNGYNWAKSFFVSSKPNFVLVGEGTLETATKPVTLALTDVGSTVAQDIDQAVKGIVNPIIDLYNNK